MPSNLPHPPSSSTQNLPEMKALSNLNPCAMATLENTHLSYVSNQLSFASDKMPEIDDLHRDNTLGSCGSWSLGPVAFGPVVGNIL